MKHTILRMFVGAAAVAAIGGAAPVERVAPLRLEVDLSERTLTVYHGGEVRNRYDVAVGEAEHPTPEGEFTIDRIIWNPGWVPPPNAEWAKDEEEKEPSEEGNPMVGAKVFFKYPDYYIHGTNAPSTVGTAASHGCIRMRPAEVEELARYVQEHGGASRSERWYREATRDDGTSHEVNLSDPIPITIRP